MQNIFEANASFLLFPAQQRNQQKALTTNSFERRANPVYFRRKFGSPSQQLQPEALQQACADAGVTLTLRMQAGYDHSYFFIASFIDEHVKFHGRYLLG